MSQATKFEAKEALKVSLSFKTPDVFSQIAHLDDEEYRRAVAVISKYVRYDEYVDIEFNIDTGTASVVRRG